MPLILDDIIVFLWRLFAHRFRESRCQKWHTISGTIEHVACPEHEMYPYVEIRYSYTLGDCEYDFRCLRGFWYDESARALANRYEGVTALKVRYSPADSSMSYILDQDQSFS